MNAEIKHSAALASISVGGFVLFISGLFFVGSVVAFLSDNGPGPGVGIVLAIIGVLTSVPGGWLIRRGVRLRRRAIKSGSMLYLPSDGTGQTSRTEVKKPSFLTDGEPDPPLSVGSRSMTFDSPDRSKRDPTP